jgi:polysaccharide export outer membrane protein
VRPGYYNLAQGTPLDILIAQAGGATHQADLRSVVIRRPLVDGTVQEERVDLYTPLMQGQSPPLFRLQGGDTVIVSPLDTGRTQDYDREFVARTALAKPTITVRVLAPQGGGQGIGGVGTAIRNLELPNGSTFLDVVNQFPAYSPLLVREQVTLLRFDPEQGKVVRQELNPINTARELDFSQYVSLRDQDVIVVSRTLLGKFLAFFNILTQPIRDVFGFVNTIDRFDNFNRNRR